MEVTNNGSNHVNHNNVSSNVRAGALRGMRYGFAASISLLGTARIVGVMPPFPGEGKEPFDNLAFYGAWAFVATPVLVGGGVIGVIAGGAFAYYKNSK